MQLEEALQSVAVLGAGGKMGRGIALILLQDIATRELDRFGTLESPVTHLILVEKSSHSLEELRIYLKDRLRRFGERHINLLREYFSGLSEIVSNKEVVEGFVDGCFNIIRLVEEAEAAEEATLVFEAIIEDVSAKVETLKRAQGAKAQFFFTNTSSIPIHVLARKTGFQNNLIGMHFYNPPSVQKLVEVVVPSMASAEVTQLGLDIAARLNKITVRSADVAGFIGNGFLMREVIFSSSQVEQLAKRLPFEEAIVVVNMISRDYLIRPMGIYQLIDFVGVDVCQQVIGIMNSYQHDKHFILPLLDKLLKSGKKGGQNADGSQRDGFFQYHGLTPVAAYQMDEGKYRLFADGCWVQDIMKGLGGLPNEWKSWKELVSDPQRQQHVEQYFDKLFEMGTPGSEVAFDFLMHGRQTASELVRQGVARSMDDVNTVLKNGFYHLYGVDVPWLDIAKVLRSSL